MKEIVTLVLIALSIGLDNFATSIAIGLSGIKQQDKIKILIVARFIGLSNYIAVVC